MCDYNDLIKTIKESYEKLNDSSLLGKRSGYENIVSNIFGWNRIDESFYDIEKEGFKVEIKKQQNAQWIDCVKISDMCINHSSMIDTYIIFIYYNKNNIKLNELDCICVTTYKDLIGILDISKDEMMNLLWLKDKKIQAKKSIAKKDIEKISKSIICKKGKI